MKKLTKILTIILTTAIMVTLPGMTTLASAELLSDQEGVGKEKHREADAGEIEESTESDQSANNKNGSTDVSIEEDSEEPKKDEVINESNSIDSVKSLSDELAYIYIDQTVVHIPEMQSIVVAFADENLVVQQAKMKYFSVVTGESYEIRSSKCVNNTVLFEKEFTEQVTEGEYRLQNITYQTVNIEKEETIELAEIGIEASFNITAEAKIVDTGADITVYSMDDVGNELARTGSVDDIPEMIQDVADEVGVERGSNDKTSKGKVLQNRMASKQGNIVVAINAGHETSNHNSGASANGLREEDLTLKVAQYCKAELESYFGVSVYMVRTGAGCPVGATTEKNCVKGRVYAAQNAGADVFIDIHFNSLNGVSTSANGSEVYYPTGNSSAAGLSNSILAQLSALGLTNRGAKSNSAYWTIAAASECGFPGLIVEHAFLDNANDAAKLKNESFLKNLGIADATGIANYFGLTKFNVKIKAEDVSGRELEYKLSTSGAKEVANIQNIKFAVWSDKNGQDDLNWYSGVRNASGEWEAIADIRNHKTAGKYYVDAFATMSNGASIFLGEKIIEITNPQMNAKIQNYNASKGTYEVLINNIVSPSGVKEIKVPVWCASDQSDIKWYSAVDQGNGTYKVSVDIANHNHSMGVYKTHIYLTAGNGIVNAIAAADQLVEPPKAEVSVENVEGKDTSYKIKIKSMDILGFVKNVQFATWSDKGGQDDLIWYSGSRSATGEWTAAVDIRKHKTAGKYYVDAYATLSNGGLKFLGEAIIAVTDLQMNANIQNYNANKGTYEVLINSIVSPSGVKEVKVPVWCASDQSDIKWYNAVDQGNGTYKVNVDIANHNHSMGVYKTHVYLTAGNGIVKAIAAADQLVEPPKVEINAVNVEGKDTSYKIETKKMNMLGIMKNVQFATWSDRGGQDDLIWYSGSRSATGEWTATVDIRKHKTAGKYYVDAYATLSNGAIKFLGEAIIDVTDLQMNAKIQNYNANKGTYEVLIDNIESPSGVKEVKVPVWCASDQSDIKWYSAVDQGNGTYKVNVDIANHNHSMGVYKTHVYLTAGNEIEKSIAAADQLVEFPKAEISAENVESKNTIYKIETKNMNMLGLVKNVQFATWSDRGGQDDLIWYSGSHSATGEWTASVDIRKHKTAGKYYVDAYATLANGMIKFLGETIFTVNEPTASSVDTTDYDEVTGSFQVVIKGVQSFAGVKEVKVPVWCASDQSDIKWYSAKKQTNGDYVVEVNPLLHEYTIGAYKIHVYVLEQNEIETYVGQTVKIVSSEQYYTIMGAPTVTINQMVKYFVSSGNVYPASALSKGGAPTLEEFCSLYYQEASAEGVRVEVAFAQAMLETGWLKYGGIVQIGQFNFAGIGALDGNTTGQCASFPNVRTGIRAQIQHLKAYASRQNLVNTCVDPRFNKVTRGCAPYVEWLGQKENPYGLGWATGENYGYHIVSKVRKLKNM